MHIRTRETGRGFFIPTVFSAAPLLSGSSPTAVPGEYVVVLNSKLRQYAGQYDLLTFLLLRAAGNGWCAYVKTLHVPFFDKSFRSHRAGACSDRPRRKRVRSDVRVCHRKLQRIRGKAQRWVINFLKRAHTLQRNCTT